MPMAWRNAIGASQTRPRVSRTETLNPKRDGETAGRRIATARRDGADATTWPMLGAGPPSVRDGRPGTGSVWIQTNVVEIYTLPFPHAAVVTTSSLSELIVKAPMVFAGAPGLEKCLLCPSGTPVITLTAWLNLSSDILKLPKSLAYLYFSVYYEAHARTPVLNANDNVSRQSTVWVDLPRFIIFLFAMNWRTSPVRPTSRDDVWKSESPKSGLNSPKHPFGSARGRAATTIDNERKGEDRYCFFVEQRLMDFLSLISSVFAKALGGGQKVGALTAPQLDCMGLILGATTEAGADTTLGTL